ncbi:MAG: family N-acetyltransferase [Symbiobacteriaceae bacterium]|jgi:GNAT superfamily N-acetyltransferase|nr:family N-acetyltransferase [Symbiobacteriaceae bacterium]
MYQVRPLSLPDDYHRLAEILSCGRPEPITVADLQEDDSKIPPPPATVRCDDQGRLVSHCRDRFAAIDETGRMVGYADAWRAPWTTPGEMICSAVVDPAHRGRGAGRMLLDRVESTAREKGAAYIKAALKDSDPAALACVTGRGYTIDRHLFQSTLDPDAFDPAPFTTEAAGIRFFTLADEPGEATEHKLYELERVSQRDNPGSPGELMPYDQWRLWVLESARVLPELFLFAADGDRLVGTTYMHTVEGGGLHTIYTGVDPAYRGRGIALALKVRAVAAARRHGAPYMRTDNDSQNGPMLAVNRKMGYRPLPGDYIVIKRLKQQ